MLLPLLLATTPSLAECPIPADRSADLAPLFEAARNAQSEAEARIYSGQMWQIWLDAPDEAAGALLQRGMAAREAYDFIQARNAFDRLVDYCPDWAEGWNQRAFVAFLTEDYASARSDLYRTVELNPDHVGALSGLALTLTALGETDEAQQWLRRALALNPWLSERHLLIGKDI